MAFSETLKQKKSLRPVKKLGQHFLVDSAVRDKIISLSGFGKNDRVLEIGPGKGALTLPLARQVDHVVAIEKDVNMVEFLSEHLSKNSCHNVTVIHKDILRTQWADLEPFFARKIQVIGNLPYNISSPVLEWLIDHRAWIKKAVLMFQLEVARRLTAQPGTKAYGALTLLVQYHAEVTGLFKVLRGSFYPIPGVDSMMVSVNFEKPFPERAVHEVYFKKVVKGAFAYRRKTLYNSLKRALHLERSEKLLKAFETSNIDGRSRAEILALPDFLRLTEALLIDNETTM